MGRRNRRVDLAQDLVVARPSTLINKKIKDKKVGYTQTSRLYHDLFTSIHVWHVGNGTKGKIVNEKQVLTLMRYYELVKEIENVHSN